jgi:hypothetical protein
MGIVLLTTLSSIMVSRSISEPGEAGSCKRNPTVGALDTDMPWVVPVGCFPTVLWLIAKVRGEHAAPPVSVSRNAA